MTQKQFIKLKKIIDKLLKKAEDEAFEEGLDISSDDFKVLFKKLKERILLEMGISLVEYEMWEKEPKKIAKEKEIAHIEKENDFDEKLKEFKEEKEEIKKLQEEFSAEIEKLAIKSKNQINKVSFELEGEIEGLKDSLKESAERINKVKSLIPKPQKWTDFPEFIRDLNEFKKQFKGFSKTLKNLEGQVIKIDKKSFPKVKDYSKELKDLRDLISGDKLEHQIHNLLGPPFRKLALGLSRRINTLDTSLASYVPYTGATANVDLGSNDLTLTGTATFGSATTESLVKILAKSEDYTKGLAVSDASYGSSCVIDGLGIEGVSVDANGNPTAFDEDLDLQYSSTGDLYLCGGGGTVFIEGASLIVSTGILYADGGLDVGTNFVDYTEIAAPANPSANIARMYSRDDSGTTKLYFRDSAGTETEMGGGGATIELDNLGTVAINTSLISDTDSTDDLGASSYYWAETYTDKLYLNSTATLDGATAGAIILTGKLGIGLTPTANMSGLSVEAGLLTIKETTAPTADADYGKLWTNTSNELWFQDGAGVSHLLHGDAFSNIWFHSSTATVLTISTEDAFTLVDTFAVVGHEDDSGNVVGSTSTNNLTLSASGGGEYEISYHTSITATGASKEIMTCVGVTLATPKDITDVTDDTVSPIVITSTAHGLNNGDIVEIAGVLGNTAANGSFIVANKTANTFEITTLDGSATTGNGDFDEGSPTGDVTIWYLGNMVARRDVSQTALGSISATGLHVLQHSDVVCLYIANLDDTSNINIYAVSLDVDRIGD